MKDASGDVLSLMTDDDTASSAAISVSNFDSFNTYST
jgi:hypothetical protein